MNISYDYTELIEELKEEVRDGILSLTDTIQVLRKLEKDINGYSPIIDWYYDDREMQEHFKLFSVEDIEISQYRKDKSYLENMLVGNALIEMKEKSQLF